MHRHGQVPGRHFDEQVIVVIHQAVGMADQSVDAARPVDEPKEVVPVRVRAVDLTSSSSA
jgi:hypothetical protein